MRKVYLDNAATTALSPKVLEKMMPKATIPCFSALRKDMPRRATI